MNEYDKMISGRLYSSSEPILVELHKKARALLDEMNSQKFGDWPNLERVVKKMFGSTGKSPRVNKPFFCDYGINIHVGDYFYANFDCVILDVNKVNIGNNVLLGPKVSIFTATHPIDKDVRATGLESGLEINIGDDVWIGGNTVVNPGVTIGSNVIIGSGSVVTKDIPSGVIAAGNPARVLRSITNEDKVYWEKEKEYYYSNK